MILSNPKLWCIPSLAAKLVIIRLVGAPGGAGDPRPEILNGDAVVHQSEAWDGLWRLAAGRQSSQKLTRWLAIKRQSGKLDSRKLRI